MSLIGTGSPIGRPAGVGEGNGSSDNPQDEKILSLMRKRFGQCSQAEDEDRQNYIKCVRISSTNNQWDEEVKKKRGSNRPALTFNLLNLVVKQIIGDYRQNKMSIKVSPAGGDSTDEVADIVAGLIRHIERDSNADEAYTNALECSARGGKGWIRILPKYEADDVFNQKLVIEPVKNPLTVYCDPSAKLLNRQDAEYMLVTEKVSKETFRSLYPKAEDYGWDVVNIQEDAAGDWADDDRIRLCEYFTKERIKARLVAFNNGAMIQVDSDEEIQAMESLGFKVIKEREAERVNIRWRKCNGSHILEERVFKTKYIPLVPVLGEEVNIEGKTCVRSAVYYAIDAQHSYNYERSTAIENSALTAKAPWLVTHKQIEMWRDQWDNANNQPQPYLIFTPDQANPNPPQRIEPATPSTAAMQNSQIAAQDIQRTTGVFNSQIGEQSNIISGVGLSEQQHQGITSTFLFVDNLRAGIEHCGRIINDWKSEFYDTERLLQIVNSEDDIETIKINEKKENPILGVTEVLNDIRVGNYDIIVTAGKAFASRRREAVEGLIKWAQAFPNQAPLVADKVLQSMDVPGGEVMAERIKRSLPPQVVNDPDSPEGQQAAQQAAQQQQMQQQLIQSKVQVEQGKNQASMTKSQADVIRANAEVEKAKASVMQTAIDTKSKQAEHAAEVFDRSRMEAQPSQPVVPSRKEDVEGHQKQQLDNGKLLSTLAQHLIGRDAVQDKQHQQMAELMGHVAQGNQAIGQHLANQNAIAAAPTEAIRDKAGRIVGSRKKLT
ncbi:unnamed protein product [Sphagnum jensenii]